MSSFQQQIRSNAEAGAWADVGFSTIVSSEEMKEATDRFWAKCQLAVDKNGKKYRTTLERTRPSCEIDYKNFNKKIAS
jgi:hypothetical protein|tara:strand:+ start:903 stop:1136 length:234 start_codon:yes stop_codon:yes gene_type:complete